MDPGSPPPPYTGNKPHTVAAPYPPPHPFNGSHSGGPFASPTRSPYGPTPLGLGPSEGVGILPYYNPTTLRTEELIAEATRRARWRFLGALAWALVIYGLVAGTSVTIVETNALRR